MIRIRQIIALITSLCPSQFVKRLIYQGFFGYHIDKTAWIGIAFIDVDHLSMGPGAHISHFNRIQGRIRLELGALAQIKYGNTIVVPRSRPDQVEMRMGARSAVTRRHFFDLSGNIVIGENTVLGGIGSQFWTHSFNTRREIIVDDIVIGSHCFIGSAVRFSPGSVIGDHCVVGIGSVVTSRFCDTHVLIAGVPARVIQPIPSNEKAPL
jgi:acetyltransferase-like isoleucine patch superfamily enzyme